MFYIIRHNNGQFSIRNVYAFFLTWHQLRFRNNNVQKDKYSVPELIYDIIIGILILTKKESQLVFFYDH